MIDISALDALEKAASPAPWAHFDNGFDGYIVSGMREAKDGENPAYKSTMIVGEYIFGGEAHEGYLGGSDKNVVFTIAARNALPALIAELRAARAVVDAALHMLRNELPHAGEEAGLFPAELVHDLDRKLDGYEELDPRHERESYDLHP